MNAQKKIQAAAAKAGYKTIPNENELPDRLVELLDARDVGKYRGQWLQGIVFYRGDIETTNDWIVAFDDGWAYKVDAEFIIWYWLEDDLVGRCRWSLKSLVRGYIEFFETGIISTDPDYQT